MPCKCLANNEKIRNQERETMPRTGTTDIFQAVKESLDICTVIQTYTGQELRRTGRSFVGLCPFHTEKTPSFSVQPDRGYYHCFGCDAKGTVIDFVMNYYQLGALDAAKKLAEDFGIPIPDLRRMSPEERKRIREQQEQQKKQRARKKALEAWSTQAYIDVCALRCMCFQSLCTAQDYYEHPEFVHTLEYCDHILDILSYGTEAEKAAVLEAKLREDLGLVGGFMP